MHSLSVFVSIPLYLSSSRVSLLLCSFTLHLRSPMSFLLVQQLEDTTVLHVIHTRSVVTVHGAKKNQKVTVGSKITYRDEVHGGTLDRKVLHMGSRANCDDMMNVIIQRGDAETAKPSHLIPKLPDRRSRGRSIGID